MSYTKEQLVDALVNSKFSPVWLSQTQRISLTHDEYMNVSNMEKKELLEKKEFDCYKVDISKGEKAPAEPITLGIALHNSQWTYVNVP